MLTSSHHDIGGDRNYEKQSIKKLTREELLELLIEQSKEVERLRTEQKRTQKQLDAMLDASALAEAAKTLNELIAAGTFGAPVGNLQSSAAQDGIPPEITAQASAILAQAREEADRMIVRAQIQCDEMVAQAKRDSQRWWSETSKRLDDFYREHTGLRELLAAEYANQG